MNFEKTYTDLIPSYTKYLASQDAHYFVAPGSSACTLGKEVIACAAATGITLPPIYFLSRKESHEMYATKRSAGPILVLRAILDIEKTSDQYPHRINIVEDYTIRAEKSLQMDAHLAESPFRSGEYFFYHILVSAISLSRNNVYIHTVDSELADYLDNKFNRSEFQFDERL